VKTVMTPNPEIVDPDITVLEALQIMHDNRFLTLPVCEADGKVLGLVDVMDVIYGCGGTEGWKSVFNSALDIQDDVSDVSSNTSFHSTIPRQAPQPKPEIGLHTVNEAEDTRQVSMLRPSKPIISNVNDSILTVAINLTQKRSSASLITANNGALAGIMTDTDITRRVIAKYLDPNRTGVSNVMTKNPTCVATGDSAMDAIAKMVENKFRHLPVTDNDGVIVGILDIAKLLNSVIDKLEKMKNKGSGTAQDAVRKVLSQHAAIGQQAEALQLLLGNVLSQAFGSSSVPTLRTLLGSMPRTVVPPSASVREAGLLMSERRQAALIVDEKGLLVGLFGFKDMMVR
jgi:CBS domain-containing protein